ncbi:MAG: rod shape-determining protein RodA [Candidatus Aminicenantes bacterium]|nr:rod shape-determining protein RodA [Candidatus Aminicenantes bacterium]
MIDRRLLSNIDWILIALLLWNSALGVVFIYSSSHYLPGNFYLRQVIWIVLSLIALFLFIMVDYKNFLTYSLHLYIVFVFPLAGMLIFGKLVARESWIRFPFFQIQPSELIKIIMILLLAQIFSEYKDRYFSWNKLLLSGGAVSLPILLVVLQPDLGTTLTYVPIILAALILAGFSRKNFILLLILALILALGVWNFFLKEYQKQRIITLINPLQDPLGTGYHILQSKIAIGSGGFLGKGYKKGTQSQLRFLPARHTDFVFSVIGEEFGYAGVIVVFLSYFLLLSRLFRSVDKSRDRAGIYIIFMVAMMIAFQFFVNVMMVIGLFPVIGIPLPFLSYGGSSLLTNYLAVSLVLNVKMRRFVNV